MYLHELCKPGVPVKLTHHTDRIYPDDKVVHGGNCIPASKVARIIDIIEEK